MLRHNMALALSCILLTGCGLSSQRIVSQQPSTVPESAVYRTMSRQVKNAVDAGDADPRVSALQKRLAANPKDLEARIALASLYEEGGHWELALDHYRLGRTQQPDSAALVLRESTALGKLHLQDEALTVLQAFASTYSETDSPILTRIAILLDGQQEYAAAEQWHRRSLASDLENDCLHNNLGYNLLLQKRFAEAATEFRIALAKNPGSAVSRNNLGLALAQATAAGERQALAEWKTASSGAAAHNNLAAVLIEQRRYREAREELGAALTLDRNFLPALKNLELVSQLDGQAAVLPVHADGLSWWQQVMGALRKAVIGQETASVGANGVPTETQASRSTTKGKQ